RGAKQRKELTPFQATALHQMPLNQDDSITDWRASSQGLLRCGISGLVWSARGQPPTSPSGRLCQLRPAADIGNKILAPVSSRTAVQRPSLFISGLLTNT